MKDMLYMSTENWISREDFLSKKRDFYSAKGVLECILDEQTLRAYNYYCIFQDEIKLLDDSLRSRFKVICFTETPIDQIEVLLERVQGRNVVLEPYGLVFEKEYIRQQGGNPVFYITGSLSGPVWQLYHNAGKSNFPQQENKVLALINKCDETVDFHWEREWRIVGDLQFNLNDIYCGLCPEEDIAHFESKYSVIFLSPYWGINKILDKLVGR
jgi:hypothetical protein